MTEPVTELTLEAPAGLIRVRADVPRRQGHRRSRSATCRPSRPTSTRPSRSRTSAPSRSTSPTAGCSTSSPTPEAFGLRLTPDEGADIVRITEMIKAAANEQLPVVHPEQPGLRRDHDRPAVRARPTTRRTAMRNVVTVSTGTLDWERPATWTGAIDRSPCGTGTSARMATLHARGRAARRRRVPPRGDPRHGLHRPARSRRRRSGTYRAIVPSDHRPGLDHRVRRATWSTRPIRSPTASRSATSGPERRRAGQRSK